jgi:hypothetical protein
MKAMVCSTVVCLSAYAGWEVGIGEVQLRLEEIARWLVFVAPRLAIVVGVTLLLYWLVVIVVNWLRGE